MSYLQRKLFSHVYRNEANEGGDGGGIPPDTAKLIAEAVAKEVAGLRAKNQELLGKVKESSEVLKSYEGIDPVKTREMFARFETDVEAKLIAEGKMSEVIDKRTERLRADYDKKLTAEAETRAKAEAKAAKLAQRTLAGALRDAAIKTGALPEAMDDIVLRAGTTWQLNDDGEPVAMNGDEVVLGKDGRTPLSPIEWAESLRETAPHLWPRAQGTNAPGSAPGTAARKPTGNFSGSPKERAQAIAARFPELSKG
jgi:hypothetical protein